MKIKKQITVPRIIAFCISCALPFLLIILGIKLLLTDTLLGATVLIFFFILPLLIGTALFFTIFSKMHIIARIAIVLVSLLLWSVFSLSGIFFGEFEYLSHYENNEIITPFEKVHNWELLPQLHDLGATTRLEYIEYYSEFAIYFSTDVHALICQYTEEEYETQKAMLDENYVFDTRPIMYSEDLDKAYIEIDGYIFRMLTVTGHYDHDIDYPPKMVFIATNDETNEIVYLSVYDDELDSIPSLKDYIYDDCGWRHIR